LQIVLPGVHTVPRIARLTLPVIAVLLAPSLVAAQMDTPAPAAQLEAGPAAEPSTDGNFTLAPAEGRHLKIDRRTGRVSICAEADGAWSCRLVADDRAAYEEDIARLEAENERLGQLVMELQNELAQRDETWIGPDEEKKLDEFLDFSDKAIRRFFGMVQELKRDLTPSDQL
jgi:cell division protein FtsB